MSSKCIICGCNVRKNLNANSASSSLEILKIWKTFSKYFTLSPLQLTDWDKIWSGRVNDNPFCLKCKSQLDKLISFDLNIQQLEKQILTIVQSISSSAQSNKKLSHVSNGNSNLNNQQIVIPSWNPGQGQDQDNLKDWNWRPDLAYTSGSPSVSQLNPSWPMDGSEFGISQQKLLPAIKPHLMTSSSSSSINKMAHSKLKSHSASDSISRNSDSSQFTNWSRNSEDVVEKFVWGGKFECEKLLTGEFICLTCGAIKTSRQLLVTHLTYHKLLESKRFSCKLCHKAFSRQREVERHERTHLTALTTSKQLQRDHKVDTDLGQGQFLYDGQWSYEKTLNGEEYKCGTCGTIKNKKQSMLSHLRWVHSLKANNGRKWNVGEQSESDWGEHFMGASLGPR